MPSDRSSHKAQARYYRNRAMTWLDEAQRGIVEPHEARGWMKHDLAWSEYHLARSKGRQIEEPNLSPEALYTVHELARMEPDEGLDTDDEQALY